MAVPSRRRFLSRVLIIGPSGRRRAPSPGLDPRRGRAWLVVVPCVLSDEPVGDDRLDHAGSSGGPGRAARGNAPGSLPTMSARIVLFGATGYMGELAARPHAYVRRLPKALRRPPPSQGRRPGDAPSATPSGLTPAPLHPPARPGTGTR